MLKETTLHQARHAHEMDRRRAHAGRISGICRPAYRSHSHARRDNFTVTHLPPMMTAANATPNRGIIGRMATWFRGRFGK